MYVAEITADGPGVWRAVEPLPGPRSHHAAIVAGGALWLIGGLQGNPARAPTPLFDVLRAQILEDGSLGPWRSVSLMPHSYATSVLPRRRALGSGRCGGQPSVRGHGLAGAVVDSAAVEVPARPLP